MTGAQPAAEPYLEAFRRMPEPEIGWLRDLRRRGIERFGSLGFPSLRSENWKYTDLRGLARRSFAVPAETPPAAGVARAVRATALADLNAHRLVLVNGRFDAGLSALDDLPRGVRLSAMADQLRDDPRAVQRALTQHLERELDSFAALNAAFCGAGAFLQIDDEVLLDRPVHVLMVSTAESQPVAIHPHLLVVAGAAARATVLEQHLGLDRAANFTNTATSISLAASAEVEHYRLQQDSTDGHHLASIHVLQQQHSALRSHAIDHGARLARTELHVELTGPGASTCLNGLYLARGRQHVDNHIRVDHSAPETRSEQRYRGVLDGHARAVFNGKVVVHPGAQHIDAHQQNHNLLLSDHAEIDTKPELEIYADDVKCSHGATVGNLDKDALFYLRARGLDAAAARALLTFAFAEDIVNRMGLPALRAHLERDVVEFLPQRELIEELV